MTFDAFKSEIITNVRKFFPNVRITITEKRGIILEARVDISEDAFLEIYHNALTGKKSYALITNGKRILGYDNYKYWHLHPLDNPARHIPCSEPSMEEIFSEMKDILSD